MRPVSTEYEINQPFGSMKTAGVRGDINRPDTVEYYVAKYGNYQPYGHAGADFACPEGTPVHAIADGTVLWADWGTNLPGDESDAGYRRRWYLYKSFPGIVTIIQHPGWVGVYAHLSDAPLNLGDRVTEGQMIALSGGTGGVAPHLHVEALVDLSYRTGGGLIYGRTNPEPYFGNTTPQEDELSAADVDAIVAETNKQAEETRRQVKEALRLAVGAIAENDQKVEDVTREFLKDRIKESSPADLAAQINAAGLATAVRDELVKLIGGK